MDSSLRNVERWLGKGWMDDEATDCSSLFSSRINSLESSGTNKARNIKVRAEKIDQYNQGRSHHKSRSEIEHNGRPNGGRNSDHNGEVSARETSSIHLLNQKNVLRQDSSIGRLCKHCNKLFDNTTTLLQHLYKVVKKKELSLVDSDQGNKDIQLDSGMAKKFTKGSPHKKVRQVSQPETKVIYKCKLCNIHLFTRNLRTQHRDKHHAGLLVPLIFEKVPISLGKPKPLHVGKKILDSKNIPAFSMTSEVRQTYRKDPREHANELLHRKKFSYVFKCDICNVILHTDYATRQHRKKLHSNLDENKKLFTKLPLEDVGSTSAVGLERKRKVDGAGEGVTAKSRKTLHKSKDRAQPDRIPVSTLYQCDVCNVFFTSGKEAADHTAVCSKDITNINIICCHICEKPYLREDLKVHLNRDHGHNNEIKIIRVRASNQERPVLHQRVIEQKLFCCNYCNAHFLTYGAFMTHMRRNIHNKKVSTCGVCGYSFLIKTLSLHMRKHHLEKSLRREDFSVWKLRSRGRWTKGNEKITESQDGLQEAAATQNCKKCSRPLQILFRCSIKDIHVDFFCRICDGVVSASTRTENNNEDHNSQSKAGAQIPEDANKNIQNKKKIKLYHCADCDLNFLNKETYRHHCKDHKVKNIVACKFCEHRFTPKSLNIHIKEHHNGVRRGRHDFSLIYQKSSADTENRTRQSGPMQVPDGSVVGQEQREEGDSSTTAPGITLHKCEVCNVHFDDEPSCRQHVTEHVPLDYWTYMVCPECGLRFENQALLRHRELHRKNITMDKAVIASYQPINTSTNVEIPGERPMKTNSANGTSVQAVDAAAKPASETNGKLLDRDQVEVSTENRRIIIEEGNSESPNHSEPSEGLQTAEVAHRNDIIRRSIEDDETMCWVDDYKNIEVKQELLPANSIDAFDKGIQCNTKKQITPAKSIIPRVNMIKIENSEKHDHSNASHCIKIETELNKEFSIINGSSATESEFYVRVKADSVSDEGSNTDDRIGQNVKKRQSADMHSTSVRRISLTANDIGTQQPSTSTSICTKPRKFDRSSIQTSTYLNAEERELNTISKGANLPTSSIEKSIETQLKRASTLVNIPSTSTSPEGKNFKTTNQLESTSNLQDIQRLFTASETVRRVPLITGNQIPNLTATTTNDGSNEQNQSKQAHDSNIKSIKDQQKSKLDEGDDDVIFVSNEEYSIIIDSDSDIDEGESDNARYLFALSNEY